MLGWIGAGFAVIFIGLFLYWQLVIAEGTYIGQWMVTWLYDITAGRYDGIKGFDEELEAIYLGRPLAAALRKEPTPLVLDIGTGTARLPLALLNQPSFRGRIIGIDHSRKMLKIAATKTRGYGDRLWLIWRDAMMLPIPTGTIDAVTCLEMIEFVPNPASLAQEAARVLRPGGLLLTTRRSGRDAHLIPGKTHSREAFQKLLEDGGFTKVEFGYWQVDYDLVWAVRAGEGVSKGLHPLEVLWCLNCGSSVLIEANSALVCEECGTQYRMSDGVVDLKL
jgi:ubiquinone/menaquinone biosynthesis C-methylase UbiE